MSAPAIIQTLVTRFRESRELYRSGRYNETQLRNEFLNPFFETLGWDMYNRSNYAPQYREVIHEDSLEIEADGSTKAPDYAFRLGTARKFFVEAKKPKVNIRYEIEPAYQLRRYAWNAHLPLSILTDFEELAVYDCRTRPDPKDSAATGRVMLFTYEEYLTRWDELAQIFSREAVWNGSFDRYAEGTKGKRGTTEVDTEFLKEIEQWRFHLARNIALRNFRPNPVAPSEEGATGVNVTPSEEGELKGVSNPHRAERQLNYAVQTTIDRILFLRICEDRKIEPTDQLLQIAEGTDIYTHLLTLFQKADQKYNSGLFHFKEEKSQTSAPDTFTPNLRIDDKVLRQIIKSTYYPCPYMFNEIPVEILGQVYEQFLGSVIRLTPGGQAKVEEKPEVRKAGGVYYTPRYIVDYIVQNTIGPLLNTPSLLPSVPLVGEGGRGVKHSTTNAAMGSTGVNVVTPSLLPSVPLAGEGSTGVTPTQALTLRIVDPACGSGSFLLGAYQYLLDWHLNYYLTHDPAAHTRGKNPPLVAAEGGEYRLTTETKKQILTSSIFGVDIDAQAVEVTKLSLLLKLLEGETGQLALGFERVLPDLGNNIRCGNSLIGWDYFEGQMFPDEEEIHRVNPFDWQRAFPHVFSQGESGGFDAVIGNPPYRRELDYKELMDVISKSTIGKKFRSARMDLWYYFAHRGIELMSPDGLLSFIVNAYWISGTGSEKLITDIKDNAHLEEIFYLDKLKVFRSVSGQHMILRISKDNTKSSSTIMLVEIKDEKSAQPFVTGTSKVKTFRKLKSELYYEGKIDIMPPDGGLLSKIEQKSIHLKELGLIRQGISENPSIVNNKVGDKYGLQTKVGKGVFVLSTEEVESLMLSEEERTLLRTYHRLEDMDRYFLSDTPDYSIIYSTKVTCPNINKFPKIKEHLKQYKIVMDNRRETKKGSNKWWHLHWPREESIWRAAKVLSIQMGERPSFVPSLSPTYVPFSVNVFVPYNAKKDSIYYTVGILNSRLLWKWFSHNAKRRGVGLEINGNVLSRAPIYKVDFSDEHEVILHNQIVNLVKHMLEIKRRTPRTPFEKELFQREILACDESIDKLVYELYDLSEKEVLAIKEII